MAKIKMFFKSICVAFSMYSKIPMPRFTWNSEDMKYHLCMFPWVGAVIGGLLWLWHLLVGQFAIGNTMFVLIATAIPLLVTGGFHVDGFMDTMDAIHSYQSKEKKLEILKDPHIGAFSVICLVTYYLIMIACLSEIKDIAAFAIVCCGFFFARAMSGISVVTFKSAKKDGMLNVTTTMAQKNIVKWSLIVQVIACVAFMAYLSYALTIAFVVVQAITYWYYQRMSDKQFGGITGDLAGFYVTLSELMTAVTAAVFSIVVR